MKWNSIRHSNQTTREIEEITVRSHNPGGVKEYTAVELSLLYSFCNLFKGREEKAMKQAERILWVEAKRFEKNVVYSEDRLIWYG